jgi:hypothetical protein
VPAIGGLSAGNRDPNSTNGIWMESGLAGIPSGMRSSVGTLSGGIARASLNHRLQVVMPPAWGPCHPDATDIRASEAAPLTILAISDSSGPVKWIPRRIEMDSRALKGRDKVFAETVTGRRIRVASGGLSRPFRACRGRWLFTQAAGLGLEFVHLRRQRRPRSVVKSSANPGIFQAQRAVIP